MLRQNWTSLVATRAGGDPTHSRGTPISPHARSLACRGTPGLGLLRDLQSRPPALPPRAPRCVAPWRRPARYGAAHGCAARTGPRGMRWAGDTGSRQHEVGAPCRGPVRGVGGRKKGPLAASVAVHARGRSGARGKRHRTTARAGAASRQGRGARRLCADDAHELDCGQVVSDERSLDRKGHRLDAQVCTPGAEGCRLNAQGLQADLAEQQRCEQQE